MEIQDHDGHLRAIHGLAFALEGWQKQWDEAAKDASTRKDLSEHEVDDVISIFYDAGFAELARSHAFICTIAAFLESLFTLSLPGVGESFSGKLNRDHSRVLQFATSISSYWDPRKPKDDMRGIAVRIDDILVGSNLGQYFGPDFKRVTTAIFSYRNRMIHHGYEWAIEIRREFCSRIETEGWSEWFSVATTGNDPWYFTMTPAFHGMCLRICDRALLAFDGLLYGDWERYNFRYANSANGAPQ